MTIEEYEAFVKEGSPFFKFETIIGEHHSVSYIMYAKILTYNNYTVYVEPLCYLYADYRGHKEFTLCNTSVVSIVISDISRASECEIKELYKYLKRYGYQSK